MVTCQGYATTGALDPDFPEQSENKGELHLGPFINDFRCMKGQTCGNSWLRRECYRSVPNGKVPTRRNGGA